MPSKRHLDVHYYFQVIDRVNTIKDGIRQHVQKFNKITQSLESDRFPFTDVQFQRIDLAPLSQSIQIVLNFQAISETTHRKACRQHEKSQTKRNRVAPNSWPVERPK
jgi:hypothetical protein